VDEPENAPPRSVCWRLRHDGPADYYAGPSAGLVRREGRHREAQGSTGIPSAGPAFDAVKCMKGKKILTVPFASQIPFVAAVVSSMVDLGKEIGFPYNEYKNTGEHSQWIQGINQGVNEHYNL